ncbi:MAG: hypothetical protein KI790_10625 [Cyclobacteriaceae bacterium]|nr:hypothetical protein [Cyclobacteriaceae bacterium HetDA_MAG_MS6]
MRTFQIILLTFIISNAWGQSIKQSPNWFDLIEGTYELKSTSKEFRTSGEIKPQLNIPAITKRTYFIVPPKEGITLFDTNSALSEENVVGKLSTSSLIELLEIDYRNTFQNPDTTWKFTHEVWYKFRINNQTFYADYRIHDLKITRQLEKLDQVISVAAQDTGYDNYYDNGYPEHFHILAFNRTQNGLTLKFDSKELDLECNCEFWEPESETYYWKELENGSLFMKPAGLKQTFEATWNGLELIQE